MNKKKYLSFFVLYIFIKITLHAQEPIIVSITEDCNPVSGNFNFDSILNGKNNYLNQIINTSTGEITIIEIGFDGIKWVLYTENDLTDIGFYNLNIPNNLLPPNTGWQVFDCDNGTMSIIGGATISILENQIENSLKIYPNPTNGNSTIRILSDFDIQSVAILNTLGVNIQQIITRSITNNIIIQLLERKKGLFYLRIKYINGNIKITKIIIN